MGTDERRVVVERVGPGRFAVTNVRGGRISVGTGDDADFSPVELLLGAIGGCTSIDVDAVTSRRAPPDSFEVDVTANKVRDDGGNHLTDIEVTFRVAFPGGPEGDGARAVLPRIVEQSRDRLCTVSRTVELGTPVSPGIA
ncbi:MAG: OsmC family protein [Streptosporangiales bacterium]|nr:OsmC family protein [Streptosporangiales bacterium]MBO0889685.1 OsmC family protein [Acidothermales bacterium]